MKNIWHLVPLSKGIIHQKGDLNRHVETVGSMIHMFGLWFGVALIFAVLLQFLLTHLTRVAMACSSVKERRYSSV